MTKLDPELVRLLEKIPAEGLKNLLIRRDQASTDFAQAQLKRPLTSVASPVRRRRIVSSDILGELEMIQEIKKAARRRKISQTALCGVGPGRITEDRW